MEEKEGNLNCDHKWEYDDVVICTNPLIQHRICIKCGRVEHKESRPITTLGVFDKIYYKFHGERNR